MTAADQAYEQAQEIYRDTDAAYARIRKDQRITEDYRRQQIAAVYVKARDALAGLADQLAKDRTEEIQRLERKAFGVDNANLPAYRDALDRVDRLQSNDQALALARRAARMGDTLQLKAIGTWAEERGSWGLLNAIAEHLPDQATAIQSLSTSAQRRRNDRMTDSMHFDAPLPRELTNWAHQVDKLAGLEASGR
jgi:hypothetical protein